MSEKTLEVLTAITLILIGIFFAIRAISLIEFDRNLQTFLGNIVAIPIFIFAIITALVLLKDAFRRKKESYEI